MDRNVWIKNICMPVGFCYGLLKNTILGYISYFKGLRNKKIDFLFVVLFILWGVVASAKPPVFGDVNIVFPDVSGFVEYGEGWLEQTAGEAYRWVGQKSTMSVMFTDQTKLYISGYIPENVADMTRCSLLVNGTEVYVDSVSNNFTFEIEVDISEVIQKNKINTIELQFDGVRTPKSDDADQRIFSALINAIRFK